jgi:Glycosyltransferase family 87
MRYPDPLMKHAPLVRTCAVAGLAVVLCGSILWSVDPHLFMTLGRHGRLAVQLAGWGCFGLGAWLVRRLPLRRALSIILLGAVGLQVAALATVPQTSTDSYRYVWDGRVQAGGVDPYRYAPDAPELRRFRDPFLWPADGPSCGGSDCTLINRPTVHTIYPPVAEGYFTLVRFLSPPGSRIRPIQVAAALVALVTTVLLILGLLRLGRDPRSAVLWAWCPLVALEAGNNAHVDVLAAGLVVLSMFLLAGARSRRRSALGGIVLGLAIATKLFPVLAGVSTLRRRPVTVMMATAGTVVAVYIPHLLAVGGGIIGYLPGYLSEEGYDSGHRFVLLNLVLPPSWGMPAAAVILSVTALAVLHRADADRPWRGAVVMTGMYLLVSSPSFPWYALMLVGLVAVDGRVEWLAVAVAGYVSWWHRALGWHTLTAYRAGFGGAAVVVLLGTLARVLVARSSNAGVVAPDHNLSLQRLRMAVPSHAVSEESVMDDSISGV